MIVETWRMAIEHKLAQSQYVVDNSFYCIRRIAPMNRLLPQYQ